MGLGGILEAGRVDRVAQVEQRTAFHELASRRASLRRPRGDREPWPARFPEHAVLLKNIHGYEDATLPRRLEALGYELMVSRQIYFFDGKAGDF
jgi:hypothetical protein